MPRHLRTRRLEVTSSFPVARRERRLAPCPVPTAAGTRWGASASHHSFTGASDRSGRIDRGARKRCRTKAADPRHWCDALTTDYWNPPTSESQHARQRILAVIVAFFLAAMLAQAGW